MLNTRLSVHVTQVSSFTLVPVLENRTWVLPFSWCPDPGILTRAPSKCRVHIGVLAGALSLNALLVFRI